MFRESGTSIKARSSFFAPAAQFFRRLFKGKLQKFFDFQEIHYARRGGHKICPICDQYFFNQWLRRFLVYMDYVFQLEIMTL